MLAASTNKKLADFHRITSSRPMERKILRTLVLLLVTSSYHCTELGKITLTIMENITRQANVKAVRSDPF